MRGPRRGIRGTLPLGSLAAMSATSLLVLLVPALSSGLARGAGDSELLYDLLKDAQATNRASLERGRLVAHLELRPGADSPTLEYEATVLWNRDRGFWIFRRSDPGKAASPNNDPTEWGASLGKQRTAYMVNTDESNYRYDPYKNMLFVYGFDPDRRDRAASIDNVTPLSNWFRCCPPSHDQGRTWSEMIGPDSPVMPDGATMRIERGPDGLIRQTRLDPGGGKMEVVFSPEDCLNVVEVTYLAENSGGRSMYGRYDWEKTPEGICVLKSCRFEHSKPGRPRDIDQIYKLEIRSIDLDADVSASRISFNALKAYLPPNVEVVDRVNNRSYLLNPAPSAVDADRFRRFSAEIRARGFLQNGR